LPPSHFIFRVAVRLLRHRCTCAAQAEHHAHAQADRQFIRVNSARLESDSRGNRRVGCLEIGPRGNFHRGTLEQPWAIQ
jgi:hypothetical protein